MTFLLVTILQFSWGDKTFESRLNSWLVSKQKNSIFSVWGQGFVSLIEDLWKGTKKDRRAISSKTKEFVKDPETQKNLKVLGKETLGVATKTATGIKGALKERSKNEAMEVEESHKDNGK